MAAPQGAERYRKLQAHHSLLSARAFAGDSLLPDTAYADFLKEHERLALPNAVPDPHEAAAITRRRVIKPRPLSANTIRKHAQKCLDESSKRLQAIEDHMWQHRQEERDLKRAEMDLVKQKKQVQRSMKDYETKLSKKQSEEAQLLQGKELAVEKYWHKDLHRRKEETRNKTQAALVGRQKLNEVTKKHIKTENELSWRYKSLLENLEHSREEMEKLSKDFQDKLRAKEEEQFHLKKALADVAITLNMEAHKLRQTGAESSKQQQHTSKKEIKDTLAQEETLKEEERSKVVAGQHFENSRRNLQHSIKEKQSTGAAKLRQGGRNLLDVRTRKQHNAEMQRFIAMEAQEVDLDMMKQEMDNKGKLVEAKRRVLNEAAQKKREERNQQELRDWEERYTYRETEASRRVGEDRLKELSRTVTHYDNVEQEMYNKAKGAEAERKRRDQILSKMEEDLNYLKRENTKRLKEVALQAEKAEQELQQKIKRENAELTKAANIREETMRSLTVQRARSQEERKMLMAMKRENQRKARIQSRSAFISQPT